MLIVTIRANKRLVSVHTLTDTSPEKLEAVTDHGRLASDLAAHGLELVLTNKTTFSTGMAKVIRGGSLYPATIRTDELGAMHVRPLASILASGSEGIPKLNDNKLKELAASKIDLYRRVLSGYQAPTQFLSMEQNDFDRALEIIANIEGRDVVLKKNSGAGGYSTKIMSKSEAVAWLSQATEDGVGPHIVQPKVTFGRLPTEIRGAGSEEQNALVERSRRELLLTELRLFITKADDTHEIIPLLRVVPSEGVLMQGHNDDYLDIEIDDELYTVLADAAKDIINKAASETGVTHALAAVDFYFDHDGMPHVMEANFRSPQLPVTRENPIAGRLAHKAVANVLSSLAKDDRVKA